VAAVAALGSKARDRRVIGSGPRAGEEFDVMVPSHVSSIAQFESGQSAQSIFSFDSALPRTLLEVNGSEGTLLFPDPNRFDGDIKIRRREDDDWQTVDTTTELSSRGTGVLDMARAIRAGRAHRAQGALAYHVLDTMLAVAESVEARQFISVDSTVEIPELLPDDWDPRASTI
jgi:predicted dehydrogenase